MASMTSDTWRAAEACIEATSPRSHGSGEGAIPLGHGIPRTIAEALGEIGVGCALVDASTERVILANEGMAQLVGRPASELRGRFFVDLVGPDDMDLGRQGLRGFADGGGNRTLRFRHTDGRLVPAPVAFRGLGRGPGVDTVLLVACPTANAGEASELRAALRDAGESIRQREDLFAFAAHELRSALTPPLLHLQAMARGSGRDAASTARGLVTAVAHVRRVTVLVEQLLDVARVRAGRLALRREFVDLSEIVRGVAARFAPESEHCETPIDTECPGPVIGRWDPLRVDQIVTNLVSNALKYGAHSPVSVTVSASLSQATLTVSDRGPGISPESQARIFERFERANEDPSVSGSGLGLWIVMRLAEAHGGSVEVFSEPEQGSSFVVRLPFE